MEIIRIIGIAMIGALLSLLIKNLKPEFSMIIPMIVTFAIIFCVLPYLTVIVEELKSISESAGIDHGYFNIILKILGISYLATISSELCKDAGENAIAARIELGAKLMIMFISLPIVENLLGLIKQIIMR